mgnify:CR=1 FL=1
MTIVQHTLVEKSVGLYREKSIDNACCTNLKSLQRITALLFYCLFLAQLLDIMILIARVKFNLLVEIVLQEDLDKIPETLYDKIDLNWKV